jgi:hypothetical protein
LRIDRKELARTAEWEPDSDSDQLRPYI